MRYVRWAVAILCIAGGLYMGYVVFFPADQPPATAIRVKDHEYQGKVVYSNTWQRVGTVYAVALENNSLVAIQVRSWGLRTLGTRWINARRIIEVTPDGIRLTLSKDEFIKRALINQ